MIWNPIIWFSDARYWIRSARSDAKLRRLRREYDIGHSFDRLYEGAQDPWGLDCPQFRYQQIKYATVLSLLPTRPYKRALDLGCGTGNLTRHLSAHAEKVLGIDVSLVAVTQATQRTNEHSNLQFQQGDALNLSCDLAGC